ncbi:MAG: metal-sensitive transcriptional regulator [Candidatus Gastranaerophilaceae bacterium]
MDNCRSKETDKKLLIRLKRIEGQIRGIHKMITDNRECMDVMIQIESAVSALKGVWEVIAANHLEECLVNENDSESKRKTIEQIVKHMKDLR